MRFIRKRPSGHDKDVSVFEFAIGASEIKLLLEILRNQKKNLPEFVEFMPARHRLSDIIKRFDKVLTEYGKENK